MPPRLPVGLLGGPEQSRRPSDLMRLVESAGMPPIAYADYFDHDKGWEIGWGSGIHT